MKISIFTWQENIHFLIISSIGNVNLDPLWVLAVDISMGRKYFRLIFLKDFVRHFSTDFSQFVPNGHLCLDSIGLLSNYMILPPPSRVSSPGGAPSSWPPGPTSTTSTPPPWYWKGRSLSLPPCEWSPRTSRSSSCTRPAGRTIWRTLRAMHWSGPRPLTRCGCIRTEKRAVKRTLRKVEPSPCFRKDFQQGPIRRQVLFCNASIIKRCCIKLFA